MNKNNDQNYDLIGLRPPVLFFRKFHKMTKKAKNNTCTPNFFWRVNDQNSANGILIQSLYNKTTFTSTKLLKIQKICISREFSEIFHYFSIKKSVWDITLYVLNTPFTIKIIGSNKLCWIYLSINSLVFMVLLPISSGQGGQYFRHTLYIVTFKMIQNGTLLP